MRITRIDRWQVVVPCRPGILERAGRWVDPDHSPSADRAGLSSFDRIPKWIVEIHTDRGITGIGESSRGEPEDAVESGIQSLLGQDPRTFALHALPLPPGADYPTFEMALIDLLGKEWGIPAYQLLGGPRRTNVKIQAWASRQAPAQTALRAEQAQQSGFDGIKVKAAMASETFRLDRDDPVVETVAAIRERCGPAFHITIDPNYRFNDVGTATALSARLEEFGNVLLEDPIPWHDDDLAPYVELKRRTSVPVAITVMSARSLVAAIESRAVRHVNIDGGMVDFVMMGWLAREAGIECWHGSGADLGIRDMSYVHACLASASCTLPSDIIGHLVREDDLITEPIEVRDGLIEPPNAPGLGVELDREALAEYDVSRISERRFA